MKSSRDLPRRRCRPKNARKSQPSLFSGLAFRPRRCFYGLRRQTKTRHRHRRCKPVDTRTIVENVAPNDLVVTPDGFILITETRIKTRQPGFDPKTGETTPSDTGINRANGIVLPTTGGHPRRLRPSAASKRMDVPLGPAKHSTPKIPALTVTIAHRHQREFNQQTATLTVAASKGDGAGRRRAGRYYITSKREGAKSRSDGPGLCGVTPQPNPQQPLTSCVNERSRSNVKFCKHHQGNVRLYPPQTQRERPLKSKLLLIPDQTSRSPHGATAWISEPKHHAFPGSRAIVVRLSGRQRSSPNCVRNRFSEEPSDNSRYR